MGSDRRHPTHRAVGRGHEQTACQSAGQSSDGGGPRGVTPNCLPARTGGSATALGDRPARLRRCCPTTGAGPLCAGAVPHGHGGRGAGRGYPCRASAWWHNALECRELGRGAGPPAHSRTSAVAGQGGADVGHGAAGERQPPAGTGTTFRERGDGGFCRVDAGKIVRRRSVWPRAASGARRFGSRKCPQSRTLFKQKWTLGGRQSSAV